MGYLASSATIDPVNQRDTGEVTGRRWRTMFAVVAALAVSIVGAGRVDAHAQLVSTNPANGSRLASAPTAITIVFTEAVQVSELRLLDTATTSHQLARPSSTGSTISVNVPDLPVGGYVFSWNVVSTDGHPIAGSIVFSVGDAALPRAQTTSTTIWRSASLVAATGRLIQYTGWLVAIGLWLYTLLCWPTGRTNKRVRRTLVVAAVTSAGGAILRVAVQPAYSNASFSAVLKSSTGRAWLAASGLTLIVALVAGIIGRRPRRTELALVFSGSIIGGWLIARGGHGAAGTHPLAGTALTIGHVTAAAIWVGGLIGLGTQLCAQDDSVKHSATRFSRLATFTVVALAATGVAQGVRQLDSLDALTHSDYGHMLMVKAGLIGVLLAVAAVSRYVLRDAELNVGSIAGPRVWTWSQALPKTVRVEIVLAATIAVATALLSGASPIAAKTANPKSFEIVNDRRTADVLVTPAVVGTNRIHLTIIDSDLTQPDEITATITPVDGSLAPIKVPFSALLGDHAISSDLLIPIAGAWTININVRYGDFTSIPFTGSFTVT